jgi:hypothetical protein
MFRKMLGMIVLVWVVLVTLVVVPMSEAQEPSAVLFATAAPSEASPQLINQEASPQPLSQGEGLNDAESPVWYDRMVTILLSVLGVLGVAFMAVTGQSIYSQRNSLPLSTAVHLMVLMANLTPGRVDNDRVAKMLTDWGYTVKQSDGGQVEVETGRVGG